MKSKEKLQKKVQTEIKKKDVEKALERHWSINAEDIHVKAEGSKIILTGNVTSLYQKEEAGKIAWNTPGVWTIDNKLEVEYDYSYID